MSYVNGSSFISAFPICMPFISFSYFITLSMTFSIILYKSCECEQPCLVLNLRKKAFSLSPCMLAVAFI